MDAKYVSKVVALPKDVHEKVIAMQEELAKRLGFKPSLSETIAVAVTRWMTEEL